MKRAEPAGVSPTSSAPDGIFASFLELGLPLPVAVKRSRGGLSPLFWSAYSFEKGVKPLQCAFFLDPAPELGRRRTTPRQLRIQYPGAMYHVLSRGNRREDIFVDDVDRQDFLKTLAEACQRTGWQVQANCLMRNHYHLVIETPGANLVAGVAWLQSSYTIRRNCSGNRFPRETVFVPGQAAQARKGEMKRHDHRPGFSGPLQKAPPAGNRFLRINVHN